MQAAIFVFILLGIGVLYIPHWFLRRQEHLSGKELATDHPKMAWVRWGFYVLLLLWASLILVIGIAVITPMELGNEYFLGVLTASMGMFQGGFALITDVCPLTYPRRYRFVYGGAARKVGILQFLISVGIVIVISLIGYRVLA